jgi:hypothetical protein
MRHFNGLSAALIGSSLAITVDPPRNSRFTVHGIGPRRPSHIGERQASLGAAIDGRPCPTSSQSTDEVEFLTRHLIAGPSYLAC